MKKFKALAAVILVLSLLTGIVCSAAETDSNLNYVKSSTTASKENALIEIGYVKDPVDTSTFDKERGTHVYIGNDNFSRYASAHVCKTGSSGEEPVCYDAGGNPYYVQASHTTMENRGLYVDDYYMNGVHVMEKCYARWDYIQQFILEDVITGKLATTYCADQKTTANDGYYYTIENVEDADYYGDAQAKKIRAIAYNGYWGTESGLGSLSNMISQMAASGKFTEDELSKITDGIAMTATQYAIWHFSNYKAGDVPISVYYTGDDENVGRVPEELAYVPDLVFKVYDWLLDLDPVTAGETTADTIINDKNFITNLSATAVSKVEGHENNLDTNTENDAYIADLSFTMSVIPSTANGDDLVAKVMGPDNQVVAVGRIAGQLEEGEILLKDDGNGKYTFENVLLLEGVQNLNITLEGKQELRKGVYLYTSEVINGESSQTFVGVAEGTHKVDAEENWKVKFSVKEDEPERIIRINKNNIENSVGLEGIKFDFYFVADRNEYLSGAIVLPDAADYNYSGVPDYTVVTDANGYGEFNLTENNLPDGVYLVVENEHPAIVEPVAPFYVIMPATSEDGTHLEYEVNVYPKNQVRGDVIIEKDVIEIGNDESSEDAYSTHTWIIGTSIPADIGMGKYFEISDTLDNRLDFIGNLRVQVEDKSGAVVAAVLKENTDYILTVNDVNSLEENKPSDSFTVSLTPAGMLKIESVLSSGIERIRVYFDAEINANAEMAAEIPNQATLTYKNSVGMDFYAESDIPVVYTGAAKIIKVDADNQSKVLAGAEFEVYRKATEAEIADENTEKVQLEGMDAPMVSVEFFADPTLQGEKVTKAVSDSEGMVYIYGLEYGTYYIKETKAPAGYNLLGEVKEIVINEVTHLDENRVTVLNKSGAVLPETGGIGTTWFIVTGAVLVLGAAIILITKKRVNG